ncbi:MAG TPA: histidinol dehydrogenase, partial [Candidatus Glassbacteria bacterium]|nr:histidinol dehydrogenase [Candidatus Glassbacteria bacterium]
EGDSAVADFTRRFDRVKLAPERFRVSQEEIDDSDKKVPARLREAFAHAYERLCSYQMRQLVNSWFVTGPDGEILGQRISAVEAAAIYAPGGKAAYPSSVLMAAAAARSAGVNRVALLSPPDKTGALNPAVLFAASLAGIDEIYRIGGAQAIAAAAYGTATVPAVNVIAGPGNIYVTAAKKLVFGVVNVDMLAGPSEIVVIADDSANPAWVAADLLSQAEHDERAGALLVTTSRQLAKKVTAELKKQLSTLPKKKIAGEAVENFGAVLIARSLEHAAELASRLAPEHLELMVSDPWETFGLVRNAGAVFLGPFTPEPVGDYWAGPNHVLPTSGSARSFSPLGVQAFLKRTSVIAFNRRAFERSAAPVVTMARAEGLEAHARSIEIRKKGK